MATMFIGRLLNNLCTTHRHSVGFNNQILLQTRQYAARKGTRAKREAKKIKRKIEKVETIGYIERMFKLKQFKSNRQFLQINLNDKGKSVAVDNVWSNIYHQTKVYTFEEAVQCHRETHHPTILNCPDSFIKVKIELNLQTDKKIMGPFTRIVQLPHYFDHGETRNIIAFASSAQMLEEATKAGASLVGGRELIKSIKAGDVSLNDYEFCVAHPDVLADLVLIRGLLKKKFPTTKQGTLSPALKDLVDKFVLGIRYDAVPHKLQKDYGIIECPIGTLDMDTKHLEENFSVLLNDVHSVKSKKQTSFILRTQLFSQPSKEIFKIDFNSYIRSRAPAVKVTEEELPEDEDDVSHAVIPSQ
ncbi:hypothetical protein KPH14_006404 [Odynerus spinipes]|uniref:39S ribosomal protein L1, mitochondrial n=1 Tax=Odynerus spinipes TaxID=1348599 RepID=A0AAD9RZ59_9HYME|nr:hypothetical protein KPH14_006404 [Odynerus spinipes]